MNSILPKDMENEGKINWPYAFESIEFNPNNVYYEFDIISMSTLAVIGTVILSVVIVCCVYGFVIEPVIKKMGNKKR